MGIDFKVRLRLCWLLWMSSVPFGVILALLVSILSPSWSKIAPRWPNIAPYSATLLQNCSPRRPWVYNFCVPRLADGSPNCQFGFLKSNDFPLVFQCFSHLEGSRCDLNFKMVPATPKWCHNDPKMVSKMLLWCDLNFKMVPETPKWFQNGPKMASKMLLLATSWGYVGSSWRSWVLSWA